MLKVFEALTRSSFYDNTIVIFTSDHGELLGAELILLLYTLGTKHAMN
ncbi:Choline-sulfatase [Brevibacillus laterosporus]|nr:Choline-sulfatase [Brevibacillus laterosporus]